jgi:mRNA-degrading endonuclease RelE of RelBE toxin-antitoxin system
MTDRIQKNINKLSAKEKKKIETLLVLIKTGHFSNLDLKKLKNRNDIFRVRKGDIRIIFQKNDEKITVLAIERRSDTTYNEF